MAKTYSKVTGLTAVVASAAGGITTQTESRAVSLDVAETLAVVALLSLGGAGERASVGLVSCARRLEFCRKSCWWQNVHTGLLAVVAETLRRGADLSVVANIATLVASTSRERRHIESRNL